MATLDIIIEDKRLLDNLEVAIERKRVVEYRYTHFRCWNCCGDPRERMIACINPVIERPKCELCGGEMMTDVRRRDFIKRYEFKIKKDDHRTD